MKTLWCLYREPYRGAPLTAWFEGEGFRAPRRDETALARKLKTFVSQEQAEMVAKTLLTNRATFGPAIPIRRSKLVLRLKEAAHAS